MHAQEEVDRALALCREDLTTSDVARRMGIARSTVKDWRAGRTPARRETWTLECAHHDVALLDGAAYAYLLGMYLGDGCISAAPRGNWRLRITLDSSYGGIVAACITAMEAVSRRKVCVVAKGSDRAVEISNYWKHWTCLIPQHGPGRKHTRPIVLAPWQRALVTVHVKPFLRGLIHSDGTRIVATERKGAYVRRAPRYAFSNRSEDILEIFRSACAIAGVHCTRASERQIAVYSKAAVARLDEFIGPKN